MTDTGTSTMPAASLAPEDKIVFDGLVIDQRLAQWRRHGLRIDFTNGCFDPLRRGHVRLRTTAIVERALPAKEAAR